MKHVRPVATLQSYVEQATVHGRATETGDWRIANKTHDRLLKLLAEFDRMIPDGRDVLLPLLNHADASVVCWSATHLINRFPAESVGALERIAQLPGILGGNARTTLELYRSGTLKVP